MGWLVRRRAGPPDDPAVLLLAVKFEEISDPELSAALTVYTGGWAILRAALFVISGFLLAKGFRPAFPVVLILMVIGIVQASTTFGDSAGFFGPMLAWVAVALPVPALLQLAAPISWQWFLGLGGSKKVPISAEPRSFELPRR
jgi:hypothetical protein